MAVEAHDGGIDLVPVEDEPGDDLSRLARRVSRGHDDPGDDERRVGLVLGGLAVTRTVPIASILVTVVDIVDREKDPAQEPAPSVLFPAKEIE